VSAWLRDGSRPAYLDAEFAFTYTTAWDPVTWSASCGNGTDDDIHRMVEQRLQYLAAREQKNKGKRRTSKPTQQGSDQGGGDTRKGTSASAPRSILKRKQPGKDAGDGHGHGHGPGELPPVARCHGVPPITIHDALTHRRPASWPGTSTSAWHFATHTGGTASTAAPPASACVCPVYC
jgi:hypothetical protein